MTGMNKKGQGAMEYLMTYGWAILVVMIVGIVLWQLGIFGGTGTQTKSFSGFSAGVKPLSWTVLASGATTVTFLNAEGAPITIAATAGNFPCMSSTGSTPVAMTVQSNHEFQQTTTCIGGTVGGGYNANMSLTYTKSIGTVTEPHRASGILKGSYE
ncbi:MAG: hypothetical protein MSIBF_03905 [Candidatus Altiarchaeales archaeon IMC4]|nr:MAG: hypothetical protein MSIBF_03905 [Candidatus Altiarchaeales archaeon IMC4]